jgi:SAM-dependent methyltransferase
MTAVYSRYRSVFYDLRTEGAGTGRDAAAIGLGIFIGCLPFYGFHLMLCWVVGWLLKLNRLKLYLAAHVSNPLFAPTLVFAEIQIGAWLRRGAMHELTIDTARTTNLSVFGMDALVGSLLVGGALGIAMAAATYAMSRASPDDEAFLALVRESSDRYITTSVTAWEFARGKLRGDPIYRAIVSGSLLPSGGTLVDIGCGQGLALALLADAGRRFREGTWPAQWNPPPQFEQRIGVELRSRTADVARKALEGDAEIIAADVRGLTQTRCRAALFLDVLHMMPTPEQEAVIAATAAALEPGGVILVREADASAGWRFMAVRVGNGLKAIAFGSWRQRFYFRTADQWVACFASQGLAASLQPMSHGMFANVMFRVTHAAPAGHP